MINSHLKRWSMGDEHADGFLNSHGFLFAWGIPDEFI
jgi:hypothetical protein